MTIQLQDQIVRKALQQLQNGQGMTLNNTAHCTEKICDIAAPCTRIITNNSQSWTPKTEQAIIQLQYFLEVQDMLAIPELAMPRSRKVITVCNGKREVWTDYEQAKTYFLEMMMTAEGEERD